MTAQKYRVVGYGVVALLIMVAAEGVLMMGNPAVEQPIAFNHRKHTMDLGLACQFCHPYVETGAHPGLPGVETCSMCHQVPQGTSEEAARLTAMIADGDSLQFNKLFRLPSNVFFTHRRHVGIAKLDCANCHGSIAETERPPERPLVKIKMKVCLDCHRKENQTVDCVDCHR